jgi:chemotaxis methyl-accepting protein methylase
MQVAPGEEAYSMAILLQEEGMTELQYTLLILTNQL